MKLSDASLSRAFRAIRPLMHHRPARFALAGVALAVMTLAGYSLRPMPVQTTQDISALRDPRLLSDMDRALYTAIFDAQRNGDNETVDTLISQLDNQILLGHVLANRYLSPKYETTKQELADWLANYGDHPEAGKIVAIARRKGVDTDDIAAISDTRPLKGDGYVFHLGRTTMPDSWYRGLRLWKEGQFTTAAKTFSDIGDNEKLNSWQRSAGSYWAYRSLLRSGDSNAASDQLAHASEHPLTFYGQLALARQGSGLPIRATAPHVSYSLRNDPHVLRAAALSALDMTDAAELELRSLYTKLDESDRTGLVALAAEMSLANLQLRLAQQKDLSAGEALFGNYPMPGSMVEASREIVSPALVLAVARHESGFRDEVSSGAGAQGIMQMLPSTARAVVRHAELDVADSGNAIPITKRLNDEAMSAQLGANYLQMLTREKAIGSNLMKILAGYNAGPGAVAGWSRTARSMNDPLLYLESIPYPETHNYVVQVMAHYWIYQTMMGQRPESLAQLARGEWPTLS